MKLWRPCLYCHWVPRSRSLSVLVIACLEEHQIEAPAWTLGCEGSHLLVLTDTFASTRTSLSSPATKSCSVPTTPPWYLENPPSKLNHQPPLPPSSSRTPIGTAQENQLCGTSASLWSGWFHSHLISTADHVWGSFLSPECEIQVMFICFFVNWLFTPCFCKKFLIKRIKHLSLCEGFIWNLFQEPLLNFRTRAKITYPLQKVGNCIQLCRGNISADAGGWPGEGGIVWGGRDSGKGRESTSAATRVVSCGGHTQ